MCRGRHQGHKSSGIFILIKQSCIQTLEAKFIPKHQGVKEATKYKLDEQMANHCEIPQNTPEGRERNTEVDHMEEALSIT
jgi:hypothetical protein